MQSFKDTTLQRREQQQDVAPTRQSATYMQILNARPHHVNRAVQPDTSFNQHLPTNVNVQSPQDVDLLGHFEE